MWRRRECDVSLCVMYCFNKNCLLFLCWCLLCSMWSSEGVETEVLNGSVRCKSQHLTSFAVLLNIRGDINVVVSQTLLFLELN